MANSKPFPIARVIAIAAFGLTVGAASAIAALAALQGPDETAAPTAARADGVPKLPVANLDVQSSTWTEKPPPSGKIRLTDFGSLTGFARFGELTGVCARVIDDFGETVESARVTFSADGAIFHPDAVTTPANGTACSHIIPLAADTHVVMRATAVLGGVEPAAIEKSVEVFAAQAPSAETVAVEAAGSGRAVDAPGAFAAIGLAVVFGIAVGVRRER